MKNPPSFSIIINTLNRGPELHKTLTSLRSLKYSGEFEVIVVNGPSTDNSDDIISCWQPDIRAAKCEVANLSVSRNIGICMAQGDIVAFIDDDAIPEPEWLTQLAEAYDDHIVGAAGGLVYDHTGYDFQYKYCTVDRFGNADLSLAGPAPHLSFPKSKKIPHLLGCNSSFRRSALLEVGGFDEEFEYFLDETDVCLRIVDAGYIIAQLPCAYVHHKFAPSDLRGVNRVPRNRYPIIKNKIYFMWKHAREFYSLNVLMHEQEKFIQKQSDEVKWAINEKLLVEKDLVTFENDLERAIETGLKRGIEGVTGDTLINRDKLVQHAGVFLPFTLSNKETNYIIILISKDYPPDHGGGIATFSKDLAEALAAKGNIVHIITQSPDINRVDFENGVWVHRIISQEIERSPEAVKKNIPQHIWNWSATALKETKRIATHRKIDIVEAPIWDCEGIAFLYDRQWPLVTSLHTTLYFWLESHPKYKNNQEWLSSFGHPMLALEKELIENSNSIRANSKAIIQAIQASYNLDFDMTKTKLVPHGLSDTDQYNLSTSNKPSQLMGTKKIDVLFVGRLEERKGIDILLKAVPYVLNHVSDIRFRIIGDDTLLNSDNVTYKEVFMDENKGQKWLNDVQFEGRVNDKILWEAYANCDIFVAPSRFESFGLIFLEAMRAGKPVIGCMAGGVPEIVRQNVNGILVEPDNADALAEAILRLVKDENLRRSMGSASRKIFTENFTSQRMALESYKVYQVAMNDYRIKNS